MALGPRPFVRAAAGRVLWLHPCLACLEQWIKAGELLLNRGMHALSALMHGDAGMGSVGTDLVLIPALTSYVT